MKIWHNLTKNSKYTCMKKPGQQKLLGPRDELTVKNLTLTSVFFNSYLSENEVGK